MQAITITIEFPGTGTPKVDMVMPQGEYNEHDLLIGIMMAISGLSQLALHYTTKE